MDDKFYLKKFIRDDGETLSFDGVEILLAEDNELLVQADPATTEIEYTEQDGGEMIRQRITISEQTINGLIIPKNTSYMTLRAKLSGFFQLNHEYKLVYKQRNGEMFAVHDCWISEGFKAPPQPYENYSPWTIAFHIGSPYWQQYSEDSSGSEIYTNIVTLPLLSSALGGEVWEEESKLPVIGDLTYMQDFAKYDSAGIQAIVNSMVEEQVYTLKDSRDQQDYPIIKAKGGFVLMCKNLQIGSNDEETVLKAADSDFEGEDITLPKGDNKDFDGFGIQKLYIDETYGGFYNYFTATAGQGTQEFTGKTNQSILPKGWTLMTPEQITQLILAYGGDNAEGSAALRAAPLNLQLGGRLYQNDHNSNVGYFMSSNVEDGGNATHLRLEPSRVFTQAYIKTIGTNIRGILRTGGVV